MPLILLVYVAFVAIALPDGLLGVAWPQMRLAVGVPLDALGWLVPFGVAASLLSSASTGFLIGRIGLGRLLAISTGLSATALVGYGAATSFWVVIAATVLMAAASGAVDAGLNAFAAQRFNARRITWMHAGYGLGAAAGPALISLTAAGHVSWVRAYQLAALVQVVLALIFARSARAWVAESDQRRAVRSGRPLRSRALWWSAALFALETGVESTVALWSFVFLTEGRGLATAPAAAVVSAYWVALCAGRVVLGPVADRYGVHRVLTGGVAAVTLGAVLLALPAPPPVAVAGLVLIAVGAAPVFPLLTLTTRDRVRDVPADTAVGVQVAASVLGAATVPVTVGLLVGGLGVQAFGPSLLVFALAVASVYARQAREVPGARPVQQTD